MQLSTLKFSKDFFQKPSICFFSVQKQIFVVENSLILTFDLRFELCKIFRYVFLQNLHSLVVLALRSRQKRIGDGSVLSHRRFGQRNVFLRYFPGVSNLCVCDMPMMTSAFSKRSLSVLNDGLCARISRSSNPSLSECRPLWGKCSCCD